MKRLLMIVNYTLALACVVIEAPLTLAFLVIGKLSVTQASDRAGRYTYPLIMIACFAWGAWLWWSLDPYVQAHAWNVLTNVDAGVMVVTFALWYWRERHS